MLYKITQLVFRLHFFIKFAKRKEKKLWWVLKCAYNDFRKFQKWEDEIINADVNFWKVRNKDFSSLHAGTEKD